MSSSLYPLTLTDLYYQPSAQHDFYGADVFDLPIIGPSMHATDTSSFLEVQDFGLDTPSLANTQFAFTVPNLPLFPRSTNLHQLYQDGSIIPQSYLSNREAPSTGFVAPSVPEIAEEASVEPPSKRRRIEKENANKPQAARKVVNNIRDPVDPIEMRTTAGGKRMYYCRLCIEQHGPDGKVCSSADKRIVKKHIKTARKHQAPAFCCKALNCPCLPSTDAGKATGTNFTRTDARLRHVRMEIANQKENAARRGDQVEVLRLEHISQGLVKIRGSR